MSNIPDAVVKPRTDFKPTKITADMPFFKDTMPPKKDLSAHCNLDDEDKNNDCWHCNRFLFPIGCMVGEDGEGRASE